MPAMPSATQERTRQILEDLEAVRENLLALSDDIWLSIDHNDPKALEEGVEYARGLCVAHYKRWIKGTWAPPVEPARVRQRRVRVG